MTFAAVLRALVIAAAVAVPAVVFPGESGYRVAKDSLFIALSILIAAVAAIGFLWRGSSQPAPWRDRVTLLSILILVWSAITTFTSTNRTLSLFSFAWIAANVVFFLAARSTSRTRPAGAALWPLIPAALNAILLVCQVTEIWNPILFPKFIEEYELKKLRYTALLGNPNDVGAYFVPAALGTLALALAWRGWKRYAMSAAAAVFALSVFLSEALTGMIALLVSAAILAALVWRRAVILSVVVVIGIGVAAAAFYPPLTERVARVHSAIEEGDLDTLMSGRITAFVAAYEMWKQRPFLGVGPGCFGFHYLDTKYTVEKKYAKYLAGDIQMYREVHNDHLQVLAQSGVPGYLLFLAALILLALQTYRARNHGGDPRLRFVHLLALPLAVAFAVEGLAAFPLELSSVLATYLYYAALCMGWRE